MILLLEKEDNLISSFIDKLICKVPAKCIVNVSLRTNNDTWKELERPPLLFPKWLVITNTSLRPTQFKLLASLESSCIVIVKATSRKSFKQTLETFSDLEITVQQVDNYDISKDVIVQYVMQELHTTEDVAKFLARRKKYYPKEVVSAVRLLSLFDSVDKSKIRKFVAPYDSIPLYTIFDYLCGFSDNYIDYAGAVKLVYQYRYGFSRVLQYVISTCELYLTVFTYIQDGSLSISNYRDFRMHTADSAISDLAEYHLSRIINRHEEISSEFLFWLLQTAKGIPNDKSGIPQFISLLQVVKGG